MITVICEEELGDMSPAAIISARGIYLLLCDDFEPSAYALVGAAQDSI